MVKDLNYIIKRIIIGVGIGLVLCLFRDNFLIGVNAAEISAYNWGNQNFQIGSGTGSVDFNVTGNPWANWRYGYLYFDFAINKIGGSATDDIVIPRGVVAASGNVNYICHIGSVSSSNSTHAGTTYSATCPMDLGEPGVTHVYINFLATGPGNSTYSVWVSAQATYESAPSENVSSNISNMNNTLQQQILNDNRNTQNIVDSQNNTTNAINNNTNAINGVNDTLKDDTVDDPSSDISDMNSKVASNNSITQLLTLPIQLFQNILNSLNGSCSPFSLGTLFGHSITLPCINLPNLLGSTLYNIIDILISGLFILSFRKKMVDIFNNMTSLNDRGNELE